MKLRMTRYYKDEYQTFYVGEIVDVDPFLAEELKKDHYAVELQPLYCKKIWGPQEIKACHTAH